MENKSQRVISTMVIHALLWLFLLLLPVLTIVPFIVSSMGELPKHFYLMFSYSCLLLLVVFYTNYFLLFPRYYLTNRKLTYFSLVLLTVAVLILVSRFTFIEYLDIHKARSGSRTIFMAFAVFRILLAFFLSGGLVVYERLQASEKEKLQAEISFLNSQINPHFLFNTLNGIYTLVLKQSDKAAESVSKLSSIMQYTSVYAVKPKVSLVDEINYINNYIDLQKLRLTCTTRVNYIVNGNTHHLSIEPMLLISFIENAFKHGVSAEKNSEIRIEITIMDYEIRLYVQNSKVLSNSSENTSTKVGLENTINRLRNSYPKRHVLTMNEDDKYYSVTLTLDLK